MLPVNAIAAEIATSLKKTPRLILRAPTGSGKSTQVPQILHQHGFLDAGQCIILQPRRLAARLLAARVAEEMKSLLGQTVGYHIRFDDVSSPQTKIKFVTEALLLRRLISDPSLKGVSVLVFDEFHERHLATDLTLARARQIQQTLRPDLILIVMSATLETERLSAYLEPCPILTSDARTFPVEIEYVGGPPDDREPIWETASIAFQQHLHKHPEGDVLVFMPGAYEIQRTVAALQNETRRDEWLIFPLHGELPPDQQDAAVRRYDKRKIIVATNVAETSITIDGVRVVIDSGLARVARFDPHRGINTLLTENISQSSAAQRAGRAGRTAPGHCLRLWSAHDQTHRPAQDTPEIRRVDLAEPLLTLHASGITDINTFPWLEAPDPKALQRAEILLQDLGALNGGTGAGPSTSYNSPLTSLGERMSKFPAHPRYARMLLAAQELDCVRPIALIAALTQSRPLLLRNVDKKIQEEREVLFGGEQHSDFFVQMRAWRYAEQCDYNYQRCQRLGIHVQAARQVRQTLDHFIKLCEKQGLLPRQAENPVLNSSFIMDNSSRSDSIRRCLLLAFSDQLARRCDAGTLRCDLVHGRRATLTRESVVQDDPLLVAAEIRETEQKGNELVVLLSLATAVEEAWLKEFFPTDFTESNELYYDVPQRRVLVKKLKLFRDLPLESKLSVESASDEASALLAEQVLNGNCPLKEWSDEVDQFIFRVNRLKEWCPELGLAAIDEEAKRTILTELCDGCETYKDIKDLEVLPAFKKWLSRDQLAALEALAPERLPLPGGRKAKITYAAEGIPYLSARIQDLYGVERPLTIAQNKVTLVIHVLAPNQRPIQITEDLSSFWKNSYPKIKLELQRKYPKHEWR
jgi:ATP-dependent helicase HrpB